jgi:HlyD family secretion protein
VVRKFLLPLLASIGLGVAITTVVEDSGAPEPPAESSPVPTSPYSSFVAGSGIIEAKRGNIEIGSPVSGIVSELLVRVGDHVKAGDPLFRIDDRDLQARLSTAEAKLKVAEAEVQQPKHRLKYSQDMLRRDSGAVSAQ